MRKLLLALLFCAIPAFGQSLTSTGNITAASAASVGPCATPNGCIGLVSLTNASASPSSVTVTISGTYSATLVAEGAGDGQNYQLMSAPQLVTGGTTGTYSFNIAGLQAFRIRASAYVSGTAVITLTASPASSSTGPSILSNDPCMSTGVKKQSVAINIVTATTTALVAVSGSTQVYICGIAVTIAPSATSADTFQLEQGTGATCGANITALTGLFGAGDLTSAAPPVFVTFADPGTTASTPAGYGVCAVSAGTAVSIQGVMTYVQQ
jgi:hypothetical protein